MIRKVKEGYRVVAESGRNMGTYPTKEKAEKRRRELNDPIFDERTFLYHSLESKP